MRRAEDRAVPVGHQQIVAVVKSIGACLCLRSVFGMRLTAMRPYQRRDPSLPSQAPPAGGSYAVLWHPLLLLLLFGYAVKDVGKWDDCPAIELVVVAVASVCEGELWLRGTGAM